MKTNLTQSIKSQNRKCRLKYCLAFMLIVSMLITIRVYGDSHDELINLGESAFLRGDFGLSLEHYQSHYAEDGENTRSVYNAAYLASLLQQSALADSAYRTILITDDYGILAKYRLAQSSLAQGDTSQCLEWLQSISSMKDHTIQSLALLGKLIALRGDPIEGLKFAQRAYEMNNRDPAAVTTLAICLEKNGHVKEALQLLFEISKNNPKSELLIIGYEMAEHHNLSDWMNIFLDMFELHYPMQIINQEYSSIVKPELPPARSTNDVRSVEAWLKSPCRYTYTFKWGFFRLGKMIVDVGRSVNRGGIDVIPVEYSITSSPRLPFIHVDDVYRAYLYPTLQKTSSYEMKVRETWWAYDRNYTMDYSNDVLTIREVDSEGTLVQYIQGLPENLIDGTSMMFYARDLVRRKVNQRVVTLIDYDYAWTNIEFTGEQDEIKLSGVRHNCWIVEGSADYTGVAGLSGSFRGWFTTDDEALPLKAKFKIFIGSITLTLSEVEYLAK